jgi:hypothetical protein
MPARTSLRILVIIASCLALGACGAPSPQQSRLSIAHPPTPTDTPPVGTFNFTTEDGVTLNGQVVGSGKTALVFSNGLEVSKVAWQRTAEQLASCGYLCLLYDYRGIDPSQGRDELERRDRDLQAAVGVVRARGAPSRSPPHNFLAHLRAAWVADPDGTPIQLVQRR